MDGRRRWHTRGPILLSALIAALTLGAPSARADVLSPRLSAQPAIDDVHVASPYLGFVPQGTTRSELCLSGQQDFVAIYGVLRKRAGHLREELARSILSAAVTMIGGHAHKIVPVAAPSPLPKSSPPPAKAATPVPVVPAAAPPPVITTSRRSSAAPHSAATRAASAGAA